MLLFHSCSSKLLVLQPQIPNPKSSEGTQEGKKEQQFAPASSPETAFALPATILAIPCLLGSIPQTPGELGAH